MNQLRTPDLFRYRQNYLTHKQKIKSIMNKSTESVRSLTHSQAKLLNKNNQIHEKALKFKTLQKQRQLSAVNNNFINRIYESDQRRTKQFAKQLNTSRSQIMLSKNNHLVSSARTSISRVNSLQKDNSVIYKKLSEVKSTISCRDFHKEYERHAERSSSMSKFKIDARSFRFIPKNEILLGSVDRVKNSLSASKLATLKLTDSKISTTQRPIQKNTIDTGYMSHRPGKASKNLMRLSFPVNNQPSKKIEFKNVKLEKLKSLSSTDSKRNISMSKIFQNKDKSNPENTLMRDIKRFNTFNDTTKTAKYTVKDKL